MMLERLRYDVSALVEFYAEGLTALGAVCERSWHDRLDILAEGDAARLWNPDGTLHQVELNFVAPDVVAAHNANTEVFPGCPLTFRLAESIRPAPLPLERILLAGAAHGRPPDPGVAEKLWHAHFPQTSRWGLASPFKADYHFSLVALIRCEVQAIDQHWSLHRLALSLPGGEPDETLTRELGFAQTEAASDVPWPAPDPARWQGFLRRTLERELAAELASIRTRQENYLRRELERIDEYFSHYEQELAGRAARSHSEGSRVKMAERLAAAKAEHTRRRADQVARHEIRVQPHLDALLLVAEPAWSATINFERAHAAQSLEARFVPRARRWFS